ncbi:MAG: hypothetical protein HKN73_16210 [Gemmatimonadetes bacterium]|nr:hypothetical protein [Gemmatimonadota bacterium]
MSILKPYFRSLGIWTAALGLFFLAIGGAGPGTQGVSPVHKLPALLGFSLALAGFPAGLSVGGTLLSAKASPPWGRIGALAGASLVLTLMMYVNTTVWAPNTLAASGFRFAPDDPAAATHQPSATLRAAATFAYAEAQATGEGNVGDWLIVNTMAWELERRLAHSTLPFLLTWIGVFAAYWTHRVRRKDLRLAMHWALGLFLVVSLYLAGENSYELIVLRAGGAVFFAAWFIAFIPAALFGGLGWVTALQLLGDEPPDA